MELHIRRRRGVALTLIAAMVAAGAVVAAPLVSAASAADTSAFDPGLIISDAVMYDASTMTQADIQTFLNAKGASCTPYKVGSVSYTCLKDHTGHITARAANSNCSAVAAQASVPAAQQIYTMAKACSVNPQVLLVLLQKEQGLITGAKSDSAYNFATGYGCPDTTGCSATYSGFSNQLYNAAWQFQQYHQPLARHFMPGRNNSIQYSPSATCGAETVYIQNLATAALYMYTPYVPNKAALAAGYGRGDGCSSYGNRNFFEYFSDWFGNPGNLLKNAGFNSGTKSWTSGSAGKLVITAKSSATAAQSSGHYVSVVAPKTKLRLKQTSSHKLTVGRYYTGYVWVRPDDAAATVTGSLMVQTRGGTTETSSQPFSVTGTAWTKVPVSLAVDKSGHTGFYFLVQLDTANSALLVDTASLAFSASQTTRPAAIKLAESTAGSGANGGWHYSASKGISLKKHTGGARSGSTYGYITATASGLSAYQTVTKSAANGSSYTFGIWLKSNTTAPYSGRLELSAISTAATQTASTPFTVGNSWTYRSVTLDVAQSKTTKLRLRIDADAVGARLDYDAPSLISNLVSSGSSFETAPGIFTTAASDISATVTSAADASADAIDGGSVLRIADTGATTSTLVTAANRKLGQNETFSARIWVRSATPGVPVTGTLGLGAGTSAVASESSTVDFTAGDTWTLITVSHKVTGYGLTKLIVSLGLDDPDASAILVDALRVY